MSKYNQRLFSMVLAGLVSACADNGHEDLREFVKNAGAGMQGKVDPLPEIFPLEQFVYAASEIPDPFSARKNTQTNSGHNELEPDLKRQKETLENYALENLSMVGTLQRGQHIYALVKTPDNTVHRIRNGNYLGHNFGLVTAISEENITLKEIIQESGNAWVEQVGTLRMQSQESKK
ncbi:MAG: pilus assembly protein PilP [Nitrosomonas sp.]|nr:pilus assembly protein PilP [Nitrosomonas sp.]